MVRRCCINNSRHSSHSLPPRHTPLRAAHNALVLQIPHDAQIQLALLGLDLGDIGQAIRATSGEDFWRIETVA